MSGLLNDQNHVPLMSESGQNEKVSQRAFLDRCTPESGLGFDCDERQAYGLMQRSKMMRHRRAGEEG
jgi:hypothetical protein